jgi:DNA-binding SARP family transcriptional activator
LGEVLEVEPGHIAGRLGALRLAPKPVLLHRTRLTELLENADSHRVLLLCAPVGSGKTTAVRHYLERTGSLLAYFRLSYDSSVATIDQILAATQDAPEVVIDDLDAAPPVVVDGLVSRISDENDARRYILIGRSRRRMRVHSLLASGLADLIGASNLAFTKDEVGELAAKIGAPFDDETVLQLTHDTDGWATPMAWIVRDTATAVRTLRGAIERWTEERAHLLLDLLATEHLHDREAFDAFKARLRAGGTDAQRELEEYEALGFPVVRTRRSFRPSRILMRLLRPESVAEQPAAETTPAMALHLFASFRCEIAGQELVFQRRRDRSILTYVALAEGGRATRKQLIDAFWPNADRAVATQSLRTAISRIRSAIAQVAGPESVDDYLSSADDLCLNFENVALDVRRFVEHLRRGDVEATQCAVEPAERHYSAAERLYRGRLLSAESVEPCFSDVADEMERLYLEMLVGRVQMYVASGDQNTARACAYKVLECTRDAAVRLRAMAFLDAKGLVTA